MLTEEIKNLQEIIKRMASNSFEVKKWTITLVVGVLILKSEQKQVWLALIPLACFLFLDSYYLRQEKLFRKKYNEVIRRNEEEYIPFDVNTKKFEKEVDSIFKICFSKSIFPFYGSIFAVLILVYFFA